MVSTTSTTGRVRRPRRGSHSLGVSAAARAVSIMTSGDAMAFLALVLSNGPTRITNVLDQLLRSGLHGVACSLASKPPRVVPPSH